MLPFGSDINDKLATSGECPSPQTPREHDIAGAGPILHVRRTVYFFYFCQRKHRADCMRCFDRKMTTVENGSCRNAPTRGVVCMSGTQAVRIHTRNNFRNRRSFGACLNSGTGTKSGTENDLGCVQMIYLKI